MKTFFFIICLVFVSAAFLAQGSVVDKKRVERDALTNCEVVWDSTQIISKEIKGGLFSYKAVLAKRQNSYVETKLAIDSFFQPIKSFLSKEIKGSLNIEMPYYRVKVDQLYGYSPGYELSYKEDKIFIFRDCSCGTYKGQRVSGRRIRVMRNYFFNKKSSLYLQYRSPIANTYDFKYHFENGLPKSFVSFQDTNQLHNKILFKNGKIDSLKSYYPNGELENEASLINGELNGYFIFYHSNGDEKFKVYFERNKIYHFINEEGRYDYNEIIQKWKLN